MNNAVISRVRNIYEFKRHKPEHLVTLAKRALEDREIGFGNLDIKYEDDALQVLANLANGDARVTLDTVGFIVDNLSDGQTITREIVAEAMQRSYTKLLNF